MKSNLHTLLRASTLRAYERYCQAAASVTNRSDLPWRDSLSGACVPAEDWIAARAPCEDDRSVEALVRLARLRLAVGGWARSIHSEAAVAKAREDMLESQREIAFRWRVLVRALRGQA